MPLLGSCRQRLDAFEHIFCPPQSLFDIRTNILPAHNLLELSLMYKLGRLLASTA
jgi:hypothetical protein